MRKHRGRRRPKRERRQARMGGEVAKPALGFEEVYVTRDGKKFHTIWCSSVNGVWLSGSNAISAVHVDLAFERGLEHCWLCRSES